MKPNNHTKIKSRFPALLLIAALSLCIVSCKSYIPDVPQGNVIEENQIVKLRVGMSRTQVQQLLGTPLLQDIFHANRWEYVYRIVRADKLVEQRTMTVFFDDAGRVVKWVDPKGETNTKIDLPSQKIAVVPNTTSPSVTATTGMKISDIPTPVMTSVPTLSVAVANIPVIASSAPSIAPSIAPATVPMTAIAGGKINPSIADSIEAWRKAWETQAFDAYVAHYTPQFKADKREQNTHEAWLKHRKEAILSKKSISLVLSEMEIVQDSADRARARFVQAYKADKLSETGQKILYLVNAQGQWLISKEVFIKA